MIDGKDLPKMALRRVGLSLLLIMPLMSGCSGEDTTLVTGEPELRRGEWQLVKRTYPYTGEYGEMVCARHERPKANGKGNEVDMEFYHPEVMNQQLGSGNREEASREVAEALRRKGITKVQTCEDAREYVRTRHEVLESKPSLPGLELPGGDDSPPPRAAGDAEPESLLEEEEDAELLEKIRDGQVWNHAATARLEIYGSDARIANHCSAFLIGPRHLITSAHCFPSNGNFPVHVYAGSGPGCATTYSDGNTCGDVPWRDGILNNVSVTRNPGWAGGAERDVAVVRHLERATWSAPANTSASWLRVFSTHGALTNRFWSLGYGANHINGSGSGTRRMTLKDNPTSWAGQLHFKAKIVAGRGHICRGDSGGPAINTTMLPGFDLAVGVSSGTDVVNITDDCGSGGQEFRVANTTGDWVETVVEASGTTCHNHSINGAWTYIRCWSGS